MEKKNVNEKNRSKGDYETIKRVLDILDILKQKTDEQHYISQRKLLEELQERGHDCCDKTVTNTLKTLLDAVNPMDDEDGTVPEGFGIEDYRIVVKGLQDKINARDLGWDAEAKKKLQMRGLYYQNDFSYEDVDKLVEAVLFLKNISEEERMYLVKKLQTLVSDYYPFNSAYLSSTTGELNRKLTSVYENSRIDEAIVRENLKLITEAIKKDERGCKIAFHFYGYTKDKKLECIKNEKGEPKEYVVDPYYIVLYAGKYYVICNTYNYNNASIYRIDLMRDIRLDVRKSSSSEKRGIVYRTPKRKVAGLPTDWNSEKASEFLSEHLFMFYGESREIDIKINVHKYTLLHDFFGEQFKFKKHIDDTWDLVTVKCVPKALEKWALQNYEYVEIMDEKIRENLAVECKKLEERYGKVY